MGLLSADVSLSDFWRIRVLVQPTASSCPSLFSSVSLALINHFSSVPLTSLPVSFTDPCVAPFVSTAALLKRQQTACLCLSFVTPQYEHSDWSDLYVHRQVLGALAIHVPPLPFQPTPAAQTQRPLHCSPEAARALQDDVKKQAEAISSMVREEYPTVLANRIICLLPSAVAAAADKAADSSATAADPTAAASAALSEKDDGLVYLPEEAWMGLLQGAPQGGGGSQSPAVGALVRALENPLRQFLACLLRRMGALVLRTPERCRPLVTPLDVPLLSPAAADSMGGSLPHPLAGVGNRVPGGPPFLSGVQAGAAGLLRLLPGRLQKQAADLLLLGGDPAAAAQNYQAAAEAARARGDVVWQAAAVEGQAAAVYAHLQHTLLLRAAGSAPRGGPPQPSGVSSVAASGSDLEDAAVAAVADVERETNLQRSSSLPASSSEGPVEASQGADVLPPAIEAILMPYQQRRVGPPAGGGPGVSGGPSLADGQGSRGLPLLQPLTAGAGGPYGGLSSAYQGAGDKETDKACLEQVQVKSRVEQAGPLSCYTGAPCNVVLFRSSVLSVWVFRC